MKSSVINKSALLSQFSNPWLGLGLALAVIQGCALFTSKKSETANTSLGAFRSTVSPANNPVPVPIEVATEISRIAAAKIEKNPATILTPENIANPRSIASLNPEPVKKDITSLPIQPQNSGKLSDYKVQRGDTLMKISFEKYGNVYRWREIYNINRDIISNYNILVPGTIIKIAGEEYVVIEKNGQPYLIKRGDTLSKISKWLYGNSQEWKSLWHNNPQLIHNPNKIYAGFTLYYQPHIRK